VSGGPGWNPPPFQPPGEGWGQVPSQLQPQPQPWPPGAQPYASPYGVPAAPPPKRRGATILVALVLIAAVAAAVVIVLSRRSGSHGNLSPTSGRVVYSDKFSSDSSGWPSESLPSGSSLGYASGAYVISGQGDRTHFARAPFNSGQAALGMSVSATETSGDSGDDLFGLECDHGSDKQVGYNLFVNLAGEYIVDRFTPGANGIRTATRVAHGQTGTSLARASAVRLDAACITNGGSVELILDVNGKQVLDTTDGSPGSGLWIGGLTTSTHDQLPSVVEFRDFSERNLQG
jgi:hypothetical protein